MSKNNGLANTVADTITSPYITEYSSTKSIEQYYGKTGRNGILNIDGYINGTVAAWSTLDLFTLPVGFRPIFAISSAMTTDNNVAPLYIIVNTDGKVQLRNSGGTNFVGTANTRITGSAGYIVA